MSFTEYKDDYPQDCPKCKIRLKCTSDHFGGGSHYWVHRCPKCKERYTFGTYDFELRPWPEK